MVNTAKNLDELVASRYLHRGSTPVFSPKKCWSHGAVKGRFVELCGEAVLTAAFSLVRDAQRSGDTTAWIGSVDSSFFPPDAVEGGVKLDALVVVRLERIQDMFLAADKLVRSGAFGLVVIDPIAEDMQGRTPVSQMQSRLAALARKNDAAIIVFTKGPQKEQSLGPMVSLWCEASIERVKPSVGASLCGYPSSRNLKINVIKDRQSHLAWTHSEPCNGPAGLC